MEYIFFERKQRLLIFRKTQWQYECWLLQIPLRLRKLRFQVTKKNSVFSELTYIWPLFWRNVRFIFIFLKCYSQQRGDVICVQMVQYWILDHKPIIFTYILSDPRLVQLNQSALKLIGLYNRITLRFEPIAYVLIHDHTLCLTLICTAQICVLILICITHSSLINVVGEENTLLYPLRFGNWAMQIKLTEGRLTGEKTCIFYLILIF